MDVEKKLLISSELQRRGKSVGVAYILLILFGAYGAHRFYLGETGTAVALLCMTIGGILTSILLIGFIPLMAVGVWIIVDLFLTKDMVDDFNTKLEREIYSKIK